MTACPLAEAMVASDCHQNEGVSKPRLEPAGADDCCDLTADSQGSEALNAIASTLRLDLPSPGTASTCQDVVLAGARPSPVTQVLLTQQHELGRFTLFSAFLL